MKKIYQIPEAQISEMEHTMCILEESGQIGPSTPVEPGVLSNENKFFEDDTQNSTKSGLWED